MTINPVEHAAGPRAPQALMFYGAEDGAGQPNWLL